MEMILEPHPEAVGHDDHRLVGEAHARRERRGVAAHQIRRLVDRQADAVAGAVRQAGKPVIGAESRLLDHGAGGRVDRLARHAGAHRIEGRLLRLGLDGPDRAFVVADVAEDVGPRDVRMIAFDAAAGIDEHKLAVIQRTVAGQPVGKSGRAAELDDAEARSRRADRAPAQATQRTFRVMPLPPMRTVEQTPLARTPPMRWSSWNRFGEGIDDATIRAIADAMVSSGLRDAGYVYVNIDDGWQGKRDAHGNIRPNAKFPDMKALADYVHSRGLKLGIYSSPRPRTCAGYEGSYGHVAQDARTYAAWGVDYLKYDLCSGEWFYDTRERVERSYTEMGAALRATGRPIIFSLCEYGRFDVGSWGRDVGGHLWRTTGDITDDYRTMARIGSEDNGDPADAGPGGWNDPDMLEIGNGRMSAAEYCTHIALWAMSAAPLLMGNDVREMDAPTRALIENRQAIAIDQDPLGSAGHAVRVDGDLAIWRRDLANGDAAIAIFNRGEAAREAKLAVEDIGASAPCTLRDVWTGAAIAAGTRQFSVPAHGVVFLRATFSR